MEIRERLFGGEGSVGVASLVGALTPPFTAALFCELSPGGSVGAHRQADDDEIVIALDGEASIYVDKVVRAVGPLDVVSLKHGSTLEIANASLEHPFRYLIVKARRAAP